MLKSRFLWQVWAILGVTLVISTLLFSFFIADQVERDALARIESNMLEQALALTPGVVPYLDGDSTLTPDEVFALTPGITARITLIAADGRVIADNRENPEVMDNHAARPEVLATRQGNFGVSQRFSNTLGQNMLYLSVPVEDPAGNTGYLRLALPVTAIEEQMNALRTRIATAAVVIGVLFLLIGYFLAYRVTNPITNMTEIARNVATGEYDLRLPDDREDEIGQLAVVINELARGAQGRIDELTESRNELEAVLAGLTEGVIAFDNNQRIIHINDAALKMLGLEHAQVANSNFAEVHTAREIRQAVETCISEESNMIATVGYGGRSLECSVVITRDIQNTNTGALMVLEDITERRHLEQVRSDFVANASHELKTPISAVRGLIETIIDDPNMPQETFTRFVERIRVQTIRLDNIVQDLLQLSRFDSDEREKSVTSIDLTGLLRQVYQAKMYDATDAGVDLQLDLQVDTLRVIGEAEGLNQMVTNLVDNAIKYSGEGGEVKIRLFKAGAMARIEVEDNGIGISTDERERIFERFYRVDRARSREQGGTGLGLAIVKHIAQSHNGSVKVDSQLGKGSTFAVRIPLAEAA